MLCAMFLIGCNWTRGFGEVGFYKLLIFFIVLKLSPSGINDVALSLKKMVASHKDAWCLFEIR